MRLIHWLGSLKIIRINSSIPTESVRYIFKYGIYIADALQIASVENFETFLTFDKKLAEIAFKEGFGKIH